MAAVLERERALRAETPWRKRFSVGTACGTDIGSHCRTIGPDLGGDHCGTAQAADSNQQERGLAIFPATRHHLQKKKSLRAAEQHRADVARARRRWIREQGMLDPARLVFIDETAVTTKMVRLWGRGPRGIELIGRAPCGEWQTITFVAALRHNKMVAPMAVQGAMNTEMFLAYVEQCLVPTLKRGDIVVMDNVSTHKSPRIREAVENARATLRYLPQYSPDFLAQPIPLATPSPRLLGAWLSRVGRCMP